MDLDIHQVGIYLFDLIEEDVEEITSYVLGFYLYCNYPILFDYIKNKIKTRVLF